MATPLASNLPVTVQFREQYVSQALNAKMQAIPRGIVRGAILKPTATNNEFTIAVDPLTGDTVINAVGVAGLASGTNDDYVVTYRTTSNLTFSATVAPATTGTLNFIYFLGGYTPLTTTNAQIVSYTQTEFENGDPDAAGGVLLGVVVANTAAPLATDRILYSGMSNGVTGATKRIPFRRHNCENFAGGQGYRPIRERVASRMDFGYKAATRVPYFLSDGAAFLSDFQNASTAFAYTSVDTPVGNGALRYAPAGADAVNTIVALVGDAFDVPANTSYPRKVRVEVVYRTVAPYSATLVAPSLSYTLANGTVGGLNFGNFAPAISPTYLLTSTDWALSVTECDIPENVGGVNIVSLRPNFTMVVTGGEVQIAAMTFILSEGVGVPSQVDYGNGGGLPVPNSYGNLAVSAPLHQSTAVSSAVSVLQVKDAAATTSEQQDGWRIGNVPSQFYNPSSIPAGPNLYLTPETNSATSKLFIGFNGAQDVETAALEARYASVEVRGDTVGPSATYEFDLRDIPLRVDEIRPYGGYLTSSNRIDLRDFNGSSSTYPPPFLSSAGTAGATGRLVFNTGTGDWEWYGGSVNRYVNMDNTITTSASGRQAFVTFTDNFADSYPVAFATYYSAAAGTSIDYFVQAVADSTDLTLYVRENGSTTHVPQNNDQIMFAVFGRLA
jgi:hypothetical protein